jgi:hypothetical protein
MIGRFDKLFRKKFGALELFHIPLDLLDKPRIGRCVNAAPDSRAP